MTMSAIPETLAYRVGQLERQRDRDHAQAEDDHDKLLLQGTQIEQLTKQMARLTQSVNRMTGALILASLTVAGSCIGIVITVVSHR